MGSVREKTIVAAARARLLRLGRRRALGRLGRHRRALRGEAGLLLLELARRGGLLLSHLPLTRRGPESAPAGRSTRHLPG